MKKILVVDDDNEVKDILLEMLEKKGFSPIGVSGGRQAINIFNRDTPDAVLLDLRMPDMDGIETMKELKKIDPDVPIIIITAYGDIPTAVEVIKLGAYDFLVKPIKTDILSVILKRAIEKLELKREIKRLNTAFTASLEYMFGRSQIMKEIIKQIYQVSQSAFSTLLEGETGTGKSFVASIIHNLSKRAEKPFVKVDIGTIPETLIESELFGYEKGAFTGAEKKKIGFFEIADGGTILIEELENIPPFIQGKLLRVVEEKSIYHLGSTSPTDIDVRIISSTNMDVRQALKDKRLREDLFFRLSEFMISLPPLRERLEDLPFLAQRFLEDCSSELGKDIKGISDNAMNLLLGYHWPGNVRELKNVIKRAALLSYNDVIMPEHIEFLTLDKTDDKKPASLLPLKELSALVVKDAESNAIRQALRLTDGNKSKAALLLKIDYKTLLTKIKEYGIQ
ncbi:MAG: sigma-54-dependent Fis family transcriptional regulator [Nitrospirae bacterium]|nr:sigma-54-dependent Fis family transcriptional regulator [Nitrospirota bacterium]